MVRIPLSSPQPTTTAQPPPDLPGLEIECPLTGEIIEPNDVDGLIDCYERLKLKNDQIYAVLLKIRLALAAQTEGDAKTRRVQGRRRRAVVEMPSESWEQSILKEAFNSFPQYRDQVLKIDTIGVKLREYKKLVNTSGPPDLTTFRDMVARANRGQTGTPTVKVET